MVSLDDQYRLTSDDLAEAVSRAASDPLQMTLEQCIELVEREVAPGPNGHGGRRDPGTVAESRLMKHPRPGHGRDGLGPPDVQPQKGIDGYQPSKRAARVR